MTATIIDNAVRRLPLAARTVAAARRTAKLLLAAAHGVADRYERRKAVRVLMAYGDRELKDIGLHRSQIHSAVYTGGDRPRR